MVMVKGKRKGRNPSLDLDTTRSHKRGRPWKPKSDLKLPRNVVNAHLQQYHSHAQQIMNATPTATLSSLESLPNELIQYIFFLSLEINLPRASIYLSKTLSNESTYRALMLLAYFHEEEEWPVDVKYFRPAPYRTLSLEDRTALQTGIVKCRWFTLDRLHLYLPTLKWLRLAQAWHAERWYITADAEMIRKVTGTHIRTAGHRPILAQLPDINDHTEVEKYFESRSSQPDNESTPITQSCRIGAYLPYFRVTKTTRDSLESYFDAKMFSNVSILDARILPAWLVRGGPWKDENVELLQLLRQGSCCIDGSHLFEVCQGALLEGIENAVREQHIAALTTLLELRTLYDALDDQGNLIDAESLLSGPLPIEIFHLATRQQSHSSALVWLLLRASLESVPCDDAILTRWALDTSIGPPECPIALWLTQHMDGHHGDGQSFYLGGWVGSIQGRDPNPELGRPEARWFEQDLSYECYEL